MNPSRRRALLLAGSLPFATNVLGQAGAKTHVVGYWGPWTAAGKPPPVPPPNVRPAAWFEDGLAKLGYVVGKNLRIEYFFTGRESLDMIPEQARDLVARNPEVIFLGFASLTAVGSIRFFSESIPLTFMNAPERSARKVVGDDLRRPKGNVTGVAIKYEEWSAKRLELVRDLLPKARRVAVVTDAVDWGYGLDPLKAAGRGLGLEVVVCDVARHGAREGSVEVGNRALAITLQEMLRIRPDAFMAFGAFNATNRFKMFVDFERKHRLPYIGDGSGDGVAGYGMDYADHERRLLEIIVQILRGKKPADIPVDFTSRFLLTVDLKRAKEIGVEIPASILVRADQLSQ